MDLFVPKTNEVYIVHPLSLLERAYLKKNGYTLHKLLVEHVPIE